MGMKYSQLAFLHYMEIGYPLYGNEIIKAIWLTIDIRSYPLYGNEIVVKVKKLSGLT